MNYSKPLELEWDEAKSALCLAQRGFDFAYVTRAFLDPRRIVEADTRHSYGEDRYQLMGMIERRLFVVVYTPRHEALRIISARKGDLREVKHYEDSTRQD